jgi:hypothetical protein
MAVVERQASISVVDAMKNYIAARTAKKATGCYINTHVKAQ